MCGIRKKAIFYRLFRLFIYMIDFNKLIYIYDFIGYYYFSSFFLCNVSLWITL